MGSSHAAVLEELWADEPGLYGWISTTDHKRIGKRYLVTAFVFFLIGGVEAAIMRAQLALPESSLLTAEAYNQIFTMHGVTMIFWYASPILSGFGNYLVPLMLGTRDMAFPRLNAFSYWTFLLSGFLLYASFFAGASPDAGWFAYAPLTTRPYSPGVGIDFFAAAVIFLTISTTAGAINFIATILHLRAPGMTIARMPLFMWSTMTASVVSVLSLPSLTAALLFLELERFFAMPFYDPKGGGDPVLWQHLFWIFGHPWVYIVFLPATGIISMIVPVFSRRPIVGHTWVATATVLTGLVGFGVWVHHIFAAGLPQVSMSFFSAASMTIAIASTVQVFAWIATIWTGRPVLSTSMLFALGFIFVFVIGGLTGVMTAVIPFDWQVHDTYFVVAHFHYVLIGANTFPVFAAFYYWLPKITGRLMGERLGRWNFWLMFIGFNAAFFPMHISGLLGMPRRVFTFPAGVGLEAPNLVTSLGAYLFAVGVLVGIVNLVRSLRDGVPAGPDPWNADTLEWRVPSPPPSYSFECMPIVTSRNPLWETPESRDPRELEPPLAEGHEILEVTALDARETAVAKMPHSSPWPLIVATFIAAVFATLLLRSYLLAGLAAVLMLSSIAAWLWPRRSEGIV